MDDSIVQMGIYLLAMVALILGCGFLLKKINRGSFQTSGPLQVVASLSMGLKEKLVLVQIGDQQQILIGVTADRMVRLASIDGMIDGSSNESAADSEVSDTSMFKKKLQQIMQTETP